MDFPSSLKGLAEATEELILSIDLGAITPGTSRPAPPATPPISPVSSRNPTEGTPSLAETTEKTAYLRTSLEDHQAKIDSLNVKLEDAQDELRDLREERRAASKEHANAVLKDKEDEIEKCMKREERLVKMLEDKELFIKKLEVSIDMERDLENDLRKKLAEAERRVEATEQRFRDVGNHINQHENIRAEGKKMDQKVGSAGLGRNRLEFRRRKGDSITPVRAIFQVVAKGASIEKTAAL